MVPSPLTSVIGREQEAAALAELLAQARCVTILGPGGVGKSRLALHVAAELAPRFADGARFVDLATVTEAVLVLPAVARAVGVAIGDDEPLIERLSAALVDRRLLLVLDNMEQVLGAGPEIAALLVAAPGMKALVTSRTALRIAGERVFLLEPLALPDHSPTTSVGRGAAASPAVRLFIERAAAVRPGFAPDEAGLAQVAAICRRLDGLPLAIELAAARARTLTPAEILARLAPRLPLLSGGPTDMPARQRALRDTIAWSYELLSAAEAQLLRALTVFVGGCSLEAITAVCAAPGEDELSLIDRLDALVAHSLVQMRGVAGATRFLMLETLREYAAEQLAADPEAPALRARHAAWACDLARKAQVELTGSEQRAWYERLEAEHDNVRAALSWALDHDPLLAVTIAWPLWRFWWQRGYVAEGRAWLDRALALLPPALEGNRPEGCAHAVSQALNSASNLAWAEADYEASLAHAQDSLTIRQALGDPALISRGQFTVARSLANLERYDEALALYLECLAFERRRDDSEAMVGTLNNIGYIHQQRGDYEAAFRYYAEAADLSRRFGDGARTAQKLVFAGEALLALGRAAEALPLVLEAVQLAHASGGQLALIEALEGVACVLAAEGEADRPVSLLGTAEAARRRKGLVLPPDDYPRLVRAARLAHARIGGEAFALLWAAAAEQDLDAALELALAPRGRSLPLAGPAAPSLPAPPDAKPDAPTFELSPRERDVLGLLAAGLSDRQIAARLIVSTSTVNSHIKSIYSKLGLHTRVAAARFAFEHGLAADPGDTAGS